jgi:uncharacterized protein (DUF305 family)
VRSETSKKLLLIVLGLSLFLSSCASATTKQTTSQAQFSPQDLMFAQMMIPHHEQAIEMGALAPSRTTNTEVLELAKEISQEQDPEITQMKNWLEQANVSLSPMSGMGHEMHMDGMLSKNDMQKLAAATGVEFERLFLEGMIEHHEGAILMTQMIVNSQNSEVRDLANSIVTSQQEQILIMQNLLLKIN